MNGSAVPSIPPAPTPPGAPSEAVTPTHKYELLGPFQVLVNGEPADIGGQRQQRVLLALVLANGQVASTDWLVDQVWGEQPPNKPLTTLRTYISHLRRSLHQDPDAAPVLITRAPGYLLDQSMASSDLEEFRLLASQAAAALADERREDAERLARTALQCWRSTDIAGGPLAAFPSEITQLLETRLATEETMADAMLALGKHDEAIPRLHALVSQEPLRERLCAQLMTALTRAGRASEALDVMSDTRAQLVEQLGIDPSPALADLELKILQQDPSLHWQPSEPTHQAAPPAAAKPEGPRVRRIVGRDLEIKRAMSAIEGDHQVIVMTGEPGIGKSTLSQHLIAEAKANGFRVAWGRCHDGGQGTTLWPWTTIVRDLIDPIPDAQLATVLGRHADDLVRLLPEMGARLQLAPEPPRDQLSFFDAITRLIRRLVGDRPHLFAFEDLHWSDPSTAQLLALAATSLDDSPIKIVATWRDTETIPPALATSLAEIGRHAGSCRFELSGLTDTEIGTLFRRIRDHDPEPEQLTKLLELTSGNPLFVSELLHHATLNLEATATVREVIDARLGGLSAPTTVALRAASITRFSFSPTLLSLTLPEPIESVLSTLGQAEAAGVIEPSDEVEGDYRFSHSLVAEQVAAQLSGTEQAALCARTGAAAEDFGESAAVLAYFYLRGAIAGTAIKGVEYAIDAAWASSTLHDHDGAHQLLSDAVDAIDRARSAGAIAADETKRVAELRADALIERCQTEKFLRRVPDAHVSAMASFAEAESIGDASRMAVAALVYCGQSVRSRFSGRWLGYWNPAAPAIEMVSKALEAIDPDDPLRPALLLASSAELHGAHLDEAESAALSSEAVAAVRTSDDPDLLAGALHAHHTSLQRVLGIAERSDILNEMLAVSIEHGLADRELLAHRALMALHLDRRDLPAALACIDAAVAAAGRCDDELMALWPRAMKISLMTFQGKVAEAKGLIIQSFGDFERAGSAVLDTFGIQYSLIMRLTGDLPSLITTLRERLAGYAGTSYGIPLASALVEAGRVAEAGELIRSFPRSEVLAGAEAVLQFSNLAGSAQVAVATNDTELSAQLYEAMLESEGRLVNMTDGLFVLGSGSHYLGQLATVCGRFDEAERHLSMALDHHVALESKSWEAFTHLALARLFEASGFPDKAEASQHRFEALRIALGLPAMPVEEHSEGA